MPTRRFLFPPLAVPASIPFLCCFSILFRSSLADFGFGWLFHNHPSDNFRPCLWPGGDSCRWCIGSTVGASRKVRLGCEKDVFDCTCLNLKPTASHFISLIQTVRTFLFPGILVEKGYEDGNFQLDKFEYSQFHPGSPPVGAGSTWETPCASTAAFLSLAFAKKIDKSGSSMLNLLPKEGLTSLKRAANDEC